MANLTGPPSSPLLPCSVRDVQRIGILDIRLFNTDRHAGNMLVRRPRAPAPGGSSAKLDGAALLDRHAYELIPIDHGFALPEALEPPYFEWQHWPQVGLRGLARQQAFRDMEAHVPAAVSLTIC